jgi:hypothetical protein
VRKSRQIVANKERKDASGERRHKRNEQTTKDSHECSEASSAY